MSAQRVRPQRVVLTRPASEAGPWLSTLTGAGHVVRLLPLIDIVPIAHGLDANQLGAYHAVMWVSGSAVRAFAGAAPMAWPEQVRCWAPGPGTARALCAAGVAPALIDQPPPDAPQFDSEALWPVVAPQVAPGKCLLVVRGRSAGLPNDVLSGVPSGATDGTGSNGRDWLIRQCEAAGMRVDTHAAYERRCPLWAPSDAEAARQAAADGSVWLFSSAEAVAHLRHLLPRQDWATTPAVATHPRIGDALAAAGFERVRLCRPTPAAVHDILATSPGA